MVWVQPPAELDRRHPVDGDQFRKERRHRETEIADPILSWDRASDPQPESESLPVVDRPRDETGRPFRIHPAPEGELPNRAVREHGGQRFGITGHDTGKPQPLGQRVTQRRQNRWRF